MMKIVFNSEERRVHIVDGDASHLSEYADGFRFELRARNADLRVVENSLCELLRVVRSLVDIWPVPVIESDPGIDPEAAEQLNGKMFGY